MVNLHALFLVKNEADVVGDVLRSAARWAAGIHVLDNGSDDGTWEIVQRAAKQYPCINLLGQDSAAYRDELRAEMFQQARSRARRPDWWLKLDADEFYMVDPRPLFNAVPRWFDAINGSMYQYYITDIDAEEYERDPVGWSSRPLRDRLRWYSNNWAELKGVRHGMTSDWAGTSWPAGTLRFASLSVPILHYQYRSPEQVSRRLASRLQLPSFVHERERAGVRIPGESTVDWRQVLRDHAELDYDDGSLPLVARYSPARTRVSVVRSQVGWAGRRLVRPLVRRIKV